MIDTHMKAKAFWLVIDCVLYKNVSDCLYMMDSVS